MPDDLSREFLETAARLFETDTIRREPRVPDPVTREWIAGQAETQERTLRRQYHDGRPADTEKNPIPDGVLPPEWEMELASFDPSTMAGALRRWAYIKHLFRVHHKKLRPAGEAETTEDQRLAAYQLVTVEPVPVELSTGQVIHVTDRSLAALIEIARHAARIHDIQDRLEHADEVRAQILEKVRELAEERFTLDAALRQRLERAKWPWARLRARRWHRYEARKLRKDRRRHQGRLQWVHSFRDALLVEARLQRQAMYAHVFTGDGAPADDLTSVPVPWETFTSADDLAILEAVHEAGVGRTERLGEMPEPPKSKDAKGRWRYLENHGWVSACRRWGIKVPIGPAGWENRPLGQAAATFRLGADPVYEEK